VAESQDICFLAQKEDYRTFLSKRITCSPGVIVDTSGTVRGTHRGLPFYTVGQRKGLGVPWKGRLFVIEKDAECNRLIVGSREELARNVFSVHSVNWVSIPPPSEGAHLNADVCVRYRSHPLSARLCVEEKGLVSVMVQPHDQAIAPGQSAVWYEGDVLLGGGIIQ
jgi:tRNA-specific 2-thiouridylase